MTALCQGIIESFRPDGTVLDLARPSPAEVDFRDFAGRLSRIARFNGVPQVGAYSVAQHSLHGAQALLAEGAGEMLAALFLLHDAHEALIGDLPTPFQHLLEAVHGPGVRASIGRIKTAWDEAIYEAAGLPGPSAWKASWHTVIDTMDRRMMQAEARDLLGEQAQRHLGRSLPRPKSGAIANPGTIKPWPPMKSEMEWLGMLERLIGRDRVSGTATQERSFRPFSPANSSCLIAKGKTR